MVLAFFKFTGNCERGSKFDRQYMRQGKKCGGWDLRGFLLVMACLRVRFCVGKISDVSDSRKRFELLLDQFGSFEKESLEIVVVYPKLRSRSN
jgi:hypothetical protein